MLKWQVGITAEAKPIAEEVVEINSSEVSAPDKVATVADKVEQEGKVASIETGEPEVPDASVENTEDESTNLSESLPKKTEVEKPVSVESEVEIYMKDPSQSSKELSEGEINKKDLSQTKKEVSSS